MTITHAPSGWNTWDFQGFNRFVYLRDGETIVAIDFAIWDETVPARVPPPDPEHRKIGRLYDTFRWDHVTRLGPHAPLGLPARLEFKAGDVLYRAEAIDRRGTLVLSVTPLVESRQRIVFRFLAPVGATPERPGPDRGIFAGCTVRLDGATWPARYFVNIAEPYAVALAGRPATISVRPPAAVSRAPGTFGALARQALTGTGALTDAPGAMMQAICWNTLFDTRRRLVSSPVSRDWCYDWRGVLVFCWDTFLVGTFMSYEAPDLARHNFESVCAAIDELGFVPNYYMAHGAASRDRSMPPLGAYLVWKTQRLRPDKAWLRRMYPRLARWHAFWMKHRDGNGNGLLEWGSDNVDYEFPQLVPYNQKLQHTRQSAMYESGLDNSPLFDDVAFNERTCTLELDDVALSSFYAMDCDALARIADCLARPADATRYQREHARLAERINAHLWDEEHGLYVNRHWDGRYSSRWAPTSFFPLIAGVAPPDRAARMVREHLLNPAEFWGEWVIPAISRSDPAFKDNDYWRGRIWGPFNFLVAEGLRRYRLDAEAAALARKSLELFMKNWRADGGIYENYNAETGQGADVWNAARLYHWGGLLAFVAMQELIDVEPAGYLRIGSLHFPDAGLRNIRLGGGLYDVHLRNGGTSSSPSSDRRVGFEPGSSSTTGYRPVTRASRSSPPAVECRRDGRPLLTCTARAIIRIPLDSPADEPIEVTAAGPGELRLYGALVGKTTRPREVRLPDGRRIRPRRGTGSVSWAW